MAIAPLGEHFPPVTGFSGTERSEVPPLVPDHTLLRCIGRGSYGEVWLARNSLGTYRAVKIVHRHSFEDQRPFDRELHGIEKFEPISRSHEGFMDILQVGRNETDEYFYCVMELADDVGRESEKAGEQESGNFPNAQSHTFSPVTYQPRTLRHAANKQGGLPVAECLHLGLALTDALGFLHERGLVHRDIKPSNIIFVNGAPKLADIGLVTGVDATRSFVGTEGFNPPEGPGTPQADLYSLGKVLYEISTGKDRQEFPDLPTNIGRSAEREELLELNEILVKACAHDPHKRYASAKEMRADLALLESGRSIRRLRIVEKRFVIAKRVGIAATIVALMASGILYQTTREKTQAKAQVVRQYVANGTRLVNEGDLFGSLLWYAEALRLDAGNSKREEPHRIRIASVLRQCPKLLNVFSHGKMLYHAEFSPDGSKVLTSSDDHTARLWDTTTGKQLLVLQHDDEVFDARFSPDSLRIVTSCKDKAARIWDAQTGAMLRTLVHQDIVWQSRFNFDGRLVATASQDGTAQIWDPATGARVGPPMVHEGNSADGVSFSPDGRWLGTTDNKGLGYLWEVGTGLERFKNLHNGNAISFSPDSRLFVTVENDSLHVWDVRAVNEITYSPLQLAELYYSSFSPDGRTIVGCGNDFTAQVWDSATGKALFTPAVRHTAPVLSSSVSPDGRRFATAGQDTVAQVWSTASGAHVGPPLRLILHVSGIGYAPDGRRLLGKSCDQAARVWDQATGDLPGPTRPILEMEHRLISPDGRYLLQSGKSNLVWIVDASSGQTLQALPHANPLTYTSFSRDGKSVITACQRHVAPSSMANDIFLWDVPTGRRLNSYEMRQPFLLLYAAFSPDNSRVLTCGFDFTARIWDAHTGQPLSEPLRHREQISWGAFDKVGRSVVTVSLDRTARVWNGFNGKPLTPPLRHQSEVIGAFWSADGKQLHTVTADDYLQIWDLPTANPLTPPRKIQNASGYRMPPNTLTVGSSSEDLPRDDRPVADLVRLAQMLAVGRIDASGDAVPLELSELTSAWKILRQEQPGQFKATTSEIAAWHEKELADSEAETNWTAALFHLDRLSALKPDDTELQSYCAEERKLLAANKNGIALPRTAAKGIVPRNPKTPDNLLDLSKCFNWSITDSDFGGRDHGFQGLNSGILRFGEIDFDVRGLILLDGQAEKRRGQALPQRIDGIRVGRQCQLFHFLQATTWNTPNGVEVGKYILHYTDGQQCEVPLVYGRDTLDWWPPGDDAYTTASNTTDVQTGEIRFVGSFSSRSLYKNTRKNPRPDVEVSTIDFVSALTLASPFVVAITVE